MAVIQGRVSVPANSLSANVLAGNLWEFLNEDCILSLYATASAVGLNCFFAVGEEISVDDVELGSQNRMPLVPDDLLTTAGGFAGDRLVLRFRNTTGGAITAFYRIDIEPV